jgi:hypothetical protein
MKRILPAIALPFILFLILTVLQSCAPSISLFNETAYRQAVELKVVSLEMLDRASQPFDEYREEAENLRLDLLKAYEYAKGRPANEVSTRQWEIMIDPEGNLMGGFFTRWENRGTLPPAFIREFRDVISDAFDTIIGLESGKIKPEQVR